LTSLISTRFSTGQAGEAEKALILNHPSPPNN
jgi:hypothetical protein